MDLGVLDVEADKKIKGHAFFLLRNKLLTEKLYQQSIDKNATVTTTDFFDPAGDRLEALKKRIRKTRFIGVDGYQSVEEFGEKVESYLLSQLDKNFPLKSVPTEFERSQSAHASFRFHRLQNFLPRDNLVKKLQKLLVLHQERPVLGPILLAGPSGQGKSALMADLSRCLKNEDTQWLVIDHYVGADGKNSLDAWVDRMLHYLHPAIKDITGPMPESPKLRRDALSSWFSYAARRKEKEVGKSVRFILLIDALDQLSDEGKDLDLLSQEKLGSDALLIASAADGTIARERASSWVVVEVPPLTRQMKKSFVDITLSRFRKGLATNLTGKLIDSVQSDSPLFLSLAIEELRLDASHENLNATVDSILKSPDAEHLFLSKFLLDEDYGRSEVPSLGAAFMALLGASRNGLSESELGNLLALSIDPVSIKTDCPRLPQVYLSKLLTAFQPFLIDKQGNRAPMHRSFAKVALEYYSPAPVHRHLYRYFSKAYGTSWVNIETRSITESIYQVSKLANFAGVDRASDRKQLISDLGDLRNSLNVEDQNVLLMAIKVLTSEEQLIVAEHWQLCIFNSSDDLVRKISADICGLVGWLDERAYYDLAFKLVNSLLHRQQKTPLHEDLLAHTYSAVADVCSSMGEYKEAVKNYELALKFSQKFDPPDSETVATSFNNLGLAKGNIDCHEEALPLLKEALRIRRKKLGRHHKNTTSTINNIGCIYSANGDEKNALRYFSKALDAQEKVLDGSDPYLADSHVNIGFTLLSIGDLDSANKHFEKALQIDLVNFGEFHPSTGISFGGLAKVLSLRGEHRQALTLYQKATDIHERSLGPAHPHTITSVLGCATALAQLGDVASMKALHKRYAKSLIAEVGASSRQYFKLAQGFAVSMRAAGNNREALLLQKESCTIAAKVFGPLSLEAASSYSSMGALLNAMTDKVTARRYLEKSLKIRMRELGPAHEMTQLVRQRIAEL